MAESSVLPKHHQVYLVLRQQIRDGAFAGQAMPPELALAGQFGVSRITIRRAMERLTAEGAVERARGRGTFARAGEGAGASPVAASLSGNLENLLAMGLETEVRLLSHGFVPAPAEVAGALGIAARAQVLRTERVRALAGRPFSHLTAWLPEEIGRALPVEGLRTRPLLELIEAAGHRVARARQVISASLAAPDVAAALEVEPGAALLAIRRTVFDDGGRAVQRIHGLYRPDTYEHEMEYERGPGAAPLWNG
ncbi:GntR family transcriptional regulator [Frigidibacter sp. MR17.24]|uniref:GntR family transcriptional regulator n=1 Tax=Frigidibacter sp. MR17.24 TaxID=3127345 RepID=UPI003012B2E4